VVIDASLRLLAPHRRVWNFIVIDVFSDFCKIRSTVGAGRLF